MTLVLFVAGILSLLLALYLILALLRPEWFQ